MFPPNGINEMVYYFEKVTVLDTLGDLGLFVESSCVNEF